MDGGRHGRLAPDGKEVLDSVWNNIELTADTMMPCACIMRDKVLAKVGIATFCTDSNETLVVCTSASDMKFTAHFLNTGVLCRRTEIFIKSWLCTSG